jgi:hypothetical protein
MASHLQNNLIADMAAGNIIPGTHTFRMLLATASYTPNKDHNRRDDVTNEVANGNGYTTKGATVTITVTQDDANDRTSISFSEPSWPTSSISARYGIVYRDRGGASSADELVATLDFGSTITSTNGTFATNETAPFYINN